MGAARPVVRFQQSEQSDTIFGIIRETLVAAATPVFPMLLKSAVPMPVAGDTVLSQVAEVAADAGLTVGTVGVMRTASTITTAHMPETTKGKVGMAAAQVALHGGVAVGMYYATQAASDKWVGENEPTVWQNYTLNLLKYTGAYALNKWVLDPMITAAARARGMFAPKAAADGFVPLAGSEAEAKAQAGNVQDGAAPVSIVVTQPGKRPGQ
jgi:hypothetical protein